MPFLQPSGSMLGKIAGYIETIARNPQSTVFVSLAEAYRQMGLLDDALEVAEQGVAMLPGFAAGFIVLGRILAQRGSLGRAEEAFARAVEIEPASLPALKGLAKVLGLRGERDRARLVLERAAAFHPQDTGIATMLSALPLGQALPTGTTQVTVEPAVVASPTISPAADAKPSTPVEGQGEPIATATIAEIYVQQGLINKALKVYRDLIQAHPDNADFATRYRQLGVQMDSESRAQDRPPDMTATAIPPRDDIPAHTVAHEPASIALVNRLDRWLAAIQDRREHVR